MYLLPWRSDVGSDCLQSLNNMQQTDRCSVQNDLYCSIIASDRSECRTIAHHKVVVNFQRDDKGR